MKSRVNEAGNYTKPNMRKALFEKIKAGTRGGNAGQWSARKSQLLAREYKKRGGGGNNTSCCHCSPAVSSPHSVAQPRCP